MIGCEWRRCELEWVSGACGGDGEWGEVVGGRGGGGAGGWGVGWWGVGGWGVQGAVEAGRGVAHTFPASGVPGAMRMAGTLRPKSLKCHGHMTTTNTKGCTDASLVAAKYQGSCLQ